MLKRIIVLSTCALVLFQFILDTSPVQASGNPDGHFPIPKEAQAEDISHPDQIVGTGTPESCTEAAFINAVAKGGTIVFNGGNKPFTITLTKPAKVFNNQNPDVVIDGGGLVTLSGGGTTRILYMNTCDPNQVWTTPHAQNQDHPRLTVQNLTFANGNSTNEKEYDGGGAIFVRGGRFKVYNCTFINNQCASTGPDVGGGAIRVFDQYEDLPVYVVNSTFGGSATKGNKGSNGGAISSIGVSWTLINCLFSHNQATGNGGNPQSANTPGGGSGGAIYNDGNQMTLTLMGTVITQNKVNAYGSGIFFVTNDHSGDIVLDGSKVSNNIGGSWYPVLPDISMHGDTKYQIKSTHPDLSISSSILTINGQPIAIDAYMLDGYNYYKLRDLAMAFMETTKGFSLDWNQGTSEILLSPGQAYIPVGGELLTQVTHSATNYEKVSQTLNIAGKTSELNACRINGYNYFKLRDIANLLSISIDYNATTKQIILTTD